MQTTSSLCNTDAIHFFEHWYTTETVKALFVSTDGLFKSFASEEDFLKYHGLLSHMFHDTEKMQKSLKRNFEKGQEKAAVTIYPLLSFIRKERKQNEKRSKRNSSKMCSG